MQDLANGLRRITLPRTPVNTIWWTQGGHNSGRYYSVNYTLGYGLMALLVGIYLIVDRDSWARSFASSARWWNRRLGIDSHVHGDREEEQVPYIVMLGVILTVLGGAMIVIGGYWWMTS
jgi:hypothetical protein